jgi:DNA polymerase III delta subunit
MSFSAFKALQSRVVLLGGDEEILVRRALKELIEMVAPDGDDFDLIHLDADSSSPEEWFAAAGTAPFLAARRTAVVRHLLRCDDPERLLVKALPEYALVILVADEESGDESKQRRFGTLQGKWVKWVKAGGGHVEIFEFDGKSLPAILRKEADTMGTPLTSGAGVMLAEMVSGSLSRGLGELEKLSLYAGPKATITEQMVRTVVVPSREWNIFRLVESVASGDVPSSLRQLQILVGSASKADDAAHSQILPQMHRQLRLLWQARVLVDAGCAPDRVSETVRAQLAERPNLLKEPPYRQSKLMSLARMTSLPALATCFGLLSDADARLKGMLPGFSAMETLESTVLNLSKVLRGGVGV